MSKEIKECIMISDEIFNLILIKNTNCSFQEAINKAIEKLREL